MDTWRVPVFSRFFLFKFQRRVFLRYSIYLFFYHGSYSIYIGAICERIKTLALFQSPPILFHSLQIFRVKP